jgi:hypothetical protein
MNYSSSIINEFMKTGGTINGRPVAGTPTNTIMTPSLPASIVPSSEANSARRVARKRKEVREVKRAPTSEIKALLDSDPLDKKAVELYFLNKLLRLITEDEE